MDELGALLQRPDVRDSQGLLMGRRRMEGVAGNTEGLLQRPGRSGGDQCHMSGRCDQGIVFGANCFNFPRPAVAFLTRFCRVLTQFGLMVANPATGCIDYYTTNW